MKWQFKPGIPIYQQIISTIKAGIAAGDLPPGSRVPPVREMAMEAGVNPNTMQRAFSELERDGLLYSVRTSGRYVTEDPEIRKKLRLEMSGEWIAELCAKLAAIGMSREDILDAVSEQMNGMESTGPERITV